MPALLAGFEADRLGLFSVAPCVEVYALDNHTQKTTNAPIMIPGNRNLPPTGQWTKEAILQEYEQTFKGIGLLGPPVHFKTDESVLPVHRVPVAKRVKEKQAIQ